MPRTLDRRDALSAQRLPRLADVEWVVGRVSLATRGADDGRAGGQDQPASLDVVIVLEMPHGVMLGAVRTDLTDPRGRSPGVVPFVAACLRPAVGFPRRPRRLRTADPALLRGLDETLEGVEVAEAPTPEIDAAGEELGAALRGEPDPAGTYLEGGTIPEAAVSALFESAAALHRGAPWKTIDEGLLFDVAFTGLESSMRCVEVLAPIGGWPGLALFPSVDAHDDWMEALDATSEESESLDLGSTSLMLSLVRRDDLPAQMRRETAAHGWPVAAAGAYPLVDCRDRFGIPQALRESDLRALAACATAVLAFADEHARRLKRGDVEGLQGVYRAGEDVQVTLTLVADAEPWFEPPHEPLRVGPKVGRNDPCPCGSGRKYKKCCLPGDEARGRTRHD